MNIRKNSFIGNTKGCNSKVKRDTYTIQPQVQIIISNCNFGDDLASLTDPNEGNVCLYK